MNLAKQKKQQFFIKDTNYNQHFSVWLNLKNIINVFYNFTIRFASQGMKL